MAIHVDCCGNARKNEAFQETQFSSNIEFNTFQDVQFSSNIEFNTRAPTHIKGN